MGWVSGKGAIKRRRSENLTPKVAALSLESRVSEWRVQEMGYAIYGIKGGFTPFGVLLVIEEVSKCLKESKRLQIPSTGVCKNCESEGTCTQGSIPLKGFKR